MSLEERVQQLDQRIADLVQQAVRDFHQEIGRRLSEEVLQRLEQGPTGLPESFLSEEGLQPLAEEAAASGSRQAFIGLRDALACLDEARSQADILNALLEESRKFASRAAVFLTRPDGASGWGAHGFGGKEIRGLAVDYRDGGPWSRLAQGLCCIDVEATDSATLAGRLEAPAGSGGVLVPLVLRDRVAAALYADQVDGAPAPQLEALQALTYAASLAIETLPFRNRGKTPTLTSESGSTGSDTGLGLWDTGSVTAAARAAQEATPPETRPAPPEEAAAAVAEPLLEEVAEVESVETVAEAPATEPVAEDSAPDVQTEPAPEPVAEPETRQAEVEVGEFVVEDVPEEEEDTAVAAATAEVEDVALPSGDALAWEEDAEVEAEPALETSPALEAPSLAWEPEPQDAAGEEDATPDAARETQVPTFDADPADTVLLPRDLPTAAAQEPTEPEPEPTPEPPVVEAAPAVEAPPAAETPPAAQEGGGGGLFGGGQAGGGPVQVAPPEDIDDQPGRAFGEEAEEAPAAGADDEADHEKARRLARLLVSEIKLYNEEQVEEGRRSGNIYGALKEDIDRSRQMYEERTDERVRNSTDYFHQELVRLLAGGDANALGL